MTFTRGKLPGSERDDPTAGRALVQGTLNQAGARVERAGGSRGCAIPRRQAPRRWRPELLEVVIG
ncbi:MAG: hypothetical protein M3Z31_09315, partial [Pseudomonadota bacterium]|nr:hypothetical protein [Pseudomonadota bacterium]